ncbi:hypothetical protein CFC21_008880 [Triticum aestivum]|uniref:Uncharacterized protein n=2 Tax=Triticum aestivum TaxID=4565 RepID=A0A3B5Z463_WHEAT|nr:hypothetical protein CFC21_008880 [Triticum aestivum]
MAMFVGVNAIAYAALVIATVETTRKPGCAKTLKDFEHSLDAFMESCDCPDDMFSGLEQITHIHLAIAKDLQVAANAEEKEVHEEKDTMASSPMPVMVAAFEEK